MAFLSMTRLQVKSIFLLPKFFVQNEAIVKQLKTSAGFKKGKTLIDLGLGAWTVTLWESEDAMRAFYLSGAHRNIMPSLSAYSNEATTGNLTFDEADLPTWDFVHENLSKFGKFSSVLKEPTQSHLDKKIMKPKITFLTRPINPK
jgi:hypothetical protein